ncbi:MAG TPA: histidinol dehydrogenase, partial [Pyrinomonadaceae bacterium]|nr:histidinol dehydrogenase [Pyrinomonadaceae bacterium]
VAVGRELVHQISALSRAEVIKKSLSRYGAVIIANDMDEACALVNDLAPEHLEIMARDESAIASQISNVGAIFFGEHTPEVVGDYLAGPNHVLPTSGATRFSSALSVHDFIKRTSTVKFSVEELQKTARMIAALARSEGLDAHAQSALIRLR